MKNNSAKDQYFKDIKTLLPIKSTQEKKYLSKINKNLVNINMIIPIVHIVTILKNLELLKVL